MKSIFVTDEEFNMIMRARDERAEYENKEIPNRIKLLYREAIEVMKKKKDVRNASSLQRELRIGWNTAIEIIMLMEKNGVLSAQIGSKPRELLIEEKLVA